MNIIFVNATALSAGGGLSTLRQFLENIPEECTFQYYIFCSLRNLENEFSKKNIYYVYPKYITGLKRIYWDIYGLKKWSKKSCIKPDIVISLQNTTVRFDNEKIPQISYVMQAIPFVNKKWNLFNKQERTLWFYKNIYPYFMSINLGKKHYVVTQSKWIKYEFSNKFNFPLEKIFAIRPVIKINDSTEKINFNKNTFNIFCPSSAFIYKNNIEIVNALIYLKSSNYNISKIKVHITINSNDDSVLIDTIIKNQLNDNFNFIGRICYQDMLKFYCSCDLVVFPSYLETFGLPLLEAASFGKPILASNEGYSQEVISGYKGATLLDINSPDIWGKAILKEQKNPKIYNNYKADFKESWKDFFQLIKNIINEEV